MPKHYVSLVGGLGNQLFQYANARANNPEEKLQLIFEFGDKKRQHSPNKEIIDFTINNYDSITFIKRLFRVKLVFHNLILRTSTPFKNQENSLSIRRFLHSFAKVIFSWLHLKKISVISQTGTRYSKPNFSYTDMALFSSGMVSMYIFLKPLDLAVSMQRLMRAAPMPVPLASGNRYIFTSSQVSSGKAALGKMPPPPMILSFILAIK